MTDETQNTPAPDQNETPQAAAPVEPNVDVDGPDQTWTLEDLKGMSPDEQSAIMGMNPTPPEEPKADAKEPDAPEEQPAAAPEEPKAEEQPPAAAPAPAPEQPERQAFDMAQAQRGLVGVKQEMDALRERFNDGDEDDASYAKKLDALIDRRTDLQTGIAVANHQQAQAQAAAENAYWDSVDAYQAQFGDLWKPENLAVFNPILQSVNKRYDGMDVPVETRLRLAHKEFNDAMNNAVPMATTSPAAAPVPAPAKPDRPEIPPGLARMPASDGGMPEGRFAAVDAALDKDVHAGERAVEGMTEAQIEEWLRAG